MSTSWNWRDEILRRAMSGKSITAEEIIDFVGQAIMPDAQPRSKTGSGFEGLVDDPAQTTRSTDSMSQPGSNRFTKNDVHLFTCPNPSCRAVVRGRVSYELAPDADLTLDAVPTELLFKGKIVGVEIKHDCMPRVTR